VEIVPYPENKDLGEIVGAFVNVLALAADPKDYKETVTGALRARKFEVTEIEDPKPLQWRRKSGISSKLGSLALRVTKTGDIAFTTFHTFNERDT
jgi:hypothetical protein